MHKKVITKLKTLKPKGQSRRDGSGKASFDSGNRRQTGCRSEGYRSLHWLRLVIGCGLLFVFDVIIGIYYRDGAVDLHSSVIYIRKCSVQITLRFEYILTDIFKLTICSK